METWLLTGAALLITAIVVWHVLEALKSGRFDAAWPGGGIRSITRKNQPISFWGSIIGIIACGLVLAAPLLIIAIR